MVHVILLEKI
jgi:hypothetical protein